ncbi:MAG: N-acetylmuramoyl-L-alanine amidase [Rickettsiales bacterium]|nr:N-acetylmuramoyl-L-alanine amidase [Rickettsiales bacterium]
MYREHPSPNFNQRPEGCQIEMLILHYTGMRTMQDALSRMCDPEAEVSAHYMIDEDGTIYRLVADADRAWHAGLSYWRGRERLNDVSIGIEIVNPGHEFGYRPFPSAQMDAVLSLSQSLMKQHHIDPFNVIGHSDIAPERKQDPGELFNWKLLSEHQIGVWSDQEGDTKATASPGDEGKLVFDIQQKLSHYGYLIKNDGIFGMKTKQVITAFQRHFYPEHVDGNWNMVCSNRLDDLINQRP